ncbi:hypothetical protein B0H66DRAFT_175389 [Apodospora peruviana]|uniref:Prokaryotic-type class I peptide chain release factors domain-containing protein n=1 Tax=Apodospora peruviana TaxID=516989 RepID=A0AAE0IAY2_9PEZI|nr:hypothetical protein B0H66DRAFT_175389 [Apodospora peruviana]
MSPNPNPTFNSWQEFGSEPAWYCIFKIHDSWWLNDLVHMMPKLGGFSLIFRAAFTWPTKKIAPFPLPLLSTRFARHQAFDAGLDQDQLAEARKWFQTLRPDLLPKGNTVYSRSSGPGGQHVNKTESKATTTWPISQLLTFLPKILHADIRASKYYSKNSDCIIIQAQTQRSRSANTDDNHLKLFNELLCLYTKAVPEESSPEKKRKYKALS